MLQDLIHKTIDILEIQVNSIQIWTLLHTVLVCFFWKDRSWARFSSLKQTLSALLSRLGTLDFYLKIHAIAFENVLKTMAEITSVGSHYLSYC